MRRRSVRRPNRSRFRLPASSSYAQTAYSTFSLKAVARIYIPGFWTELTRPFTKLATEFMQGSSVSMHPGL